LYPDLTKDTNNAPSIPPMHSKHDITIEYSRKVFLKIAKKIKFGSSFKPSQC